jgi:hypothetical protein
MERNIHDDRLDDYVKGSFEDHTENPATDMWERIESQLPEGERKPLWYAWRRFGWPMAAALAIFLLIARLVCVEVYYKEKLQKIAAEQTQAAHSRIQDPLPKTNSASDNSAEKLSNTKSQFSENNLTARQETAGTNTRSTGWKQEQPLLQVAKIVGPSAGNTGANGNPTTPFNTFPKPLNISETQRLPAINTNDTVFASNPSALDNQTHPIPALQPDSSASQPLTFEKPLDFQIIPQKSPALSFERPETPIALTVPTKKHKEPSGWYMGVFATPHYTVERTAQVSRPGLRPLFTSQQERPQVSSDISLRIGKKINNRFAIESGLGYQHLNRTATHLARFEYREGQTIQNPGGAESRSFDYDLNTYSGSASVSLRMEVAGSNTPAALERVGARITSKESLKIIQVPVLGVARLGQGRLKAVLKAGVLGSYLAENSFEFTAQRLENTKLRFRTQDGYTIRFNRPQRFTWGYQLSAGAEFRLTKSLSISAAPTLSGDFLRKDTQFGRLPEQTAVGMNLGVVLWL